MFLSVFLQFFQKVSDFFLSHIFAGSVRFSRSISGSFEVFWILLNSLGFYRILSNNSVFYFTFGFFRIRFCLSNYFGFSHILLDSSRFSQIFLEFDLIFSYCLGSFLYSFRIRWILSIYIFLDSLEITWILSNSSGCFGIFSEYVGFSRILSNPSCFSRIFCYLLVIFSDFPYSLGFSPILSDTLRVFLYLIFFRFC